MNIDQIFKTIGMELPAVIAGFAGGLVSVMSSDSVTKWKAVLMVTTGAITAGYTTPLLGLWFEFGEEMQAGMSFLIGLTSMKLVQIITNFLSLIKKDPSLLVGLFLRKKK